MQAVDGLRVPRKLQLSILTALILAAAAPFARSTQTRDRQQAAPAGSVSPPALTIPRLQSAPTLEDFLGMQPQGEAALQMAKVSGFTQRNPHDGESVSEPTE